MAKVKTKTLDVNVHHVTRVEGHGNLVVNVQEGKLERCELEVIEAPRFFEAMLRGQPYGQASHIASRICGICAVSHATASIRAVEKAFGVEPSPQTVLLRKLNIYAELLDSHVLHVYMLVAPDLLGVGSVIPLAKDAPEVVTRALRMKKLAGDICTALCGRHTHPIAITVGGFTHHPALDELSTLAERLDALRPDLEATVELFETLSLPDFERESEYLALQQDGEYPFIDGWIASTDGDRWTVEEYKQVTNEIVVGHSSAKHAHNQRPSYMVGALARYKLNHADLHPSAQAAAAALGLTPACVNPYMISIAQVVEIVHCYEEARHLIAALLDRGIAPEEPVRPGRMSGEGVGACEAPRGTLYHHYKIKNGFVTDANCIIPTAQNLANIEADMRALVPQVIEESPEEITRELEMLVRAYDPCISCSTHMLEVKFV